MDYKGKYKGAEIDALLDQVANGNTGGGGSITEETDPIFSASPAATITTENISGWNNKVDKLENKQLSTEDFTTALKAKLDGLSNYDDTTINNALSGLQTQINTLVSGNASTAIESFNEIIAFLNGVTDSQSLDSIIASIEQQIAGKMDEVTLAAVATSGNYNDLSDKPAIPDAVTESTVSGWGFTKNTGTYSKPSTGIPKSDLASAVQTSLGKADTALQSYTEQYKGTVTSVKINGSTKTPDTSGMVDLGTIEGGSVDGDYLPLTGGTISGDLKVDGNLDVTNNINAPIVRGRWIPRNGSYELYGTSNGFEVRDIAGDERVSNIIFNGDGKKLFTDKATYTELKTVNGESILGSGDIVISGGGGSSSGGAYPLVGHGTGDTTFALTPNTFHVWDEVASLDLSLAEETAEVANEFLFQFTSGATLTALTLPDSIKWVNDTPPTIAENMIYQISILNGLAVCLEFSNVSLGSFTVSSYQTWTYYFELGMTWEEWVNSEYNTSGYTVSNNRVWQNSNYYVTNVSPSDSINNGNSYGLTYYD